MPAIERQMSDSELSEAGFPVDIGGNQFDKFRSLKKADGSLLGVIYPKVRLTFMFNRKDRYLFAHSAAYAGVLT